MELASLPDACNQTAASFLNVFLFSYFSALAVYHPVYHMVTAFSLYHILRPRLLCRMNDSQSELSIVNIPRDY